MSGRGGRGGRGRGGRGPPTNGRRAVAQNSVPWTMDSDIVLDGKPSEQFPPYNVPKAPILTKTEEKQVSCFLLFREQCQDSPLYTQARSRAQASSTARTYGQEQINKRYGQVTKATVDPFTAVPMYSHKFRKLPRTLPDLGSRPFAKEFFPPELHSTLDGDDELAGPGTKRRRVGPKTLGLSNITSYKTAEELFLPDTQQADSGANLNKALELLNTVEKQNEDGKEAYLSGEDDDDWVRGNGDEDEDGDVEEDDVYDDESGDDYNAEQYFDGNQDDEDYDEGGDDGEGFF
ncbi:DNA-directed RNA polymerase III, subunit Rpc31 [Corynascus novoguineensis]|uniref:DNA-directed RNA polymerase III subunit n=1 Tax=Corynascus novoguineensis TaxID=1126955 RepID=A0AAN7CPF9_9PEZI|nr:DNA-directed RNA polymerase III, subunit Rpc31 [Corynascus novoguineensis]